MILYKHLSAELLDNLDDVMSERIVGRKLCHECYDTGYSKSITYDRRVEKVNKTQLAGLVGKRERSERSLTTEIIFSCEKLARFFSRFENISKKKKSAKKIIWTDERQL